MNTQTIQLDVTKRPSFQPVVYLGQGDKRGTILRVELYDDGAQLTLSNYTVRFSMLLPDGRTYYSVNGTKSGNVATFEIDETYAARTVGKTEDAYVEVLSGSTLICSTNRFTVIILKSAQEGADPSTAYSNGIVEATERANEAAEAAEGVVLDAIPLMSPTVRGGAQLGTGLKVEDGKLSLDGAATVDVATPSSVGVVKPDNTTITVAADGTLSGAQTYELPTMSETVKGGAVLGSGLQIDAQGRLNALGAVTGVKGDTEADYRVGNVNLTPDDIGAVDEDAYLSGITWDMLAARFTWNDLKGTLGQDAETENLQLAKPARVSAAAMNENMDILDGAVGTLQSAASRISAGGNAKSVELIGYSNSNDVHLFYWFDDAKQNGVRILFGSSGIQKSIIVNGAYTQQWLNQ